MDALGRIDLVGKAWGDDVLGKMGICKQKSFEATVHRSLSAVDCQRNGQIPDILRLLTVRDGLPTAPRLA
jgi:hypothetical protein